MGFPLSTDIFGQLRWLVRQVKLLVFRVTKIEQGGGGGAQNINQVLTTGNTATNKSLKIVNSSGSAELFGNYLQVSSLNPNIYTIYAYQHIEMFNAGKYLQIGDGAGGVGFSIGYNGSNFQADETKVDLTGSNANIDYSSHLTQYGLELTETDTATYNRFATYGRRSANWSNSNNNASIAIGQNEGYLGAIGYTITNGTGDTISCNPTQYVITNGTKTNIINASSITATSTAAGAFPVILNFDSNATQMYSQFNNNEIGINLSPLARTYTIGEERLVGDSYFGINSLDNRLVAGISLLQTTASHNNAAGFVEIFIDNQQYWIELWN
jgi:hypothetical protein